MNVNTPMIGLLAVIISLPIGNQANANAYNAAELGTLGGANSYANAINDNGTVVGSSQATNGQTYATLWQGAEVTKLETADPNGRSWANDINNVGQILGGYQPYIRVGVLWSGPDKGVDVGRNLNAINNSGEMVGQTECHLFCYDYAYMAFSSKEGRLDSLGGFSSGANDINDKGQIVGYIDYASVFSGAGHARHATLWEGATVKELGTVGGAESLAEGINNSGQIVGWSNTLGGSIHATLWDNGAPMDLETLGGTYSSATAINEVGQVVGEAEIAGGAHHAALWHGGNVTDLNSFLDSAQVNDGWVLTGASDINNHGVIVGHGHNSISGLDRGFVLTPVPEPQTYAMLVAGLGIIGFIVHRKRVLI